MHAFSCILNEQLNQLCRNVEGRPVLSPCVCHVCCKCCCGGGLACTELGGGCGEAGAAASSSAAASSRPERRAACMATAWHGTGGTQTHQQDAHVHRLPTTRVFGAANLWRRCAQP